MMSLTAHKTQLNLESLFDSMAALLFFFLGKIVSVVVVVVVYEHLEGPYKQLSFF